MYIYICDCAGAKTHGLAVKGQNQRRTRREFIIEPTRDEKCPYCHKYAVAVRPIAGWVPEDGMYKSQEAPWLKCAKKGKHE